MRRVSFGLIIVAVLAAGLAARSALADEVADFYRGKTFTVVSGHETGTGYDIYARVLAHHIGRHIPGEPGVVVQNIVGASGLVAANWLYNVAPKDGTVIATFVPTVTLEPIFGNGAARFDPTKFTWIGNMDEGVSLCGVSKASGIETFDDLLTRETVFGGTGATGPIGRYALAVKNLLHAKIKLVSGYQGTASVKLAIERGEVQGICGLSLSSMTSQWRADVESGAFKPLLQLSGKPRPQLKGARHIDEFIRSDDDKALFALVFGAPALNRPFASGPSIPPARAQALREAFIATLKDPAFLAEAAKAQIEITPMSGQEVVDFIVRVSGSSPAVIARARQAYKN